eukprot:129924_1
MASKDNEKKVKFSMDLTMANQLSDTQNLLEGVFQETLAQPSASYVSQNDEKQHLDLHLPLAIEEEEQAINIATTPIDKTQTEILDALTQINTVLTAGNVQTKTISSSHHKTQAIAGRRPLRPLHQTTTLGHIEIPKISSPTNSQQAQSKSYATPIGRIQTIVDFTVNPIDIGVILRDNEVLISDQDLHKILDKHQEKKDELIDDLCEAYENRNDQHVSLSKDLSTIGLSWPERQKFYDIVLKRYIVKQELKQHNFVKILTKTIRRLKLDDIDLDEVQRLATDAKLKGRLFLHEVDGKRNSQYKSADDFANVFKSVSTVRPYIWRKIYKRIDRWTPNNYQKLDYEKIRNILKRNRFMNDKEIRNLESELKAFKEEIAVDPDGLREEMSVPLTPSVAVWDLNEEVKSETELMVRIPKGMKGYQNDRLLNELCSALGNDNDAMRTAELTKILILKLRFRDGSKRQRVYDMLLHHYFKKYQLNNDNFVKILKNTMREEGDWEEKDAQNVERIALADRENAEKLNGRLFVRGQPEFMSSVAFAKQFSEMEGYKENKMRKRFTSLYCSINRWETKKYEVPEPIIGQDISISRSVLSQVSAMDEDEPEILLIRNEEKDDFMFHNLSDRDKSEGLPKYIHKSIWYQSWDEKIERLIDNAVLEVSNLSLWNDNRFVQKIYDDHEFYHAVEDVFRETSTGHIHFFETFVKNNYQREMNLWKIELEHANTLTDKETAYDAIKNISFVEFDFDHDGKINKDEFKLCLLANGIKLSPGQADEIFLEIDTSRDGCIEIAELAAFKDTSDAKTMPSEIFYFKWAAKTQYYAISSEQSIDGMTEVSYLDNIAGDARFKWYCYVPSVSKELRDRFKSSHPGEGINGYWTDVVKALKVDTSMVPQKHLEQIFAVLNHYYKACVQGQMDDRSPLSQRKDDDNNITATFKIMDTQEYVYELTWWNQKGPYETNAIAIKNVTAIDNYPRDLAQYKQEQKEMKLEKILTRMDRVMYAQGVEEPEQNYRKPTEPQPQIYYLRFNAARKGLSWRWYDNDYSVYRNMGEYKEDQAKQIYTPLVEQLEASFLGNRHDNFDPDNFDLFNLCWLPELSAFLSNKLKRRGADAYVFRVTFRHKDKRFIENIEQIGYTHSEGSAFPRNIARFINDRNSLLQYSATSDAFIQRWMTLYQLFSDKQKMYFWCFILSIVTQIKYIDIEFQNQMILLPLVDAVGSNVRSQSIISRLIDYQDIQQEIHNAQNFDGSLIPPLDEWQHVPLDQNSQNQVSKTGILRRAKPEHKDNPSKSDYRWMLDEKAYARFQFNADQTVVLRMVDVIRKFVLEFEFGCDNALWPWYQNSKFCNAGFWGRVYNELCKKYNLLHDFNFHAVLQFFPKPEAESETKPDDMPPPSIRHKRKWAAIKLLENDIQRDLNYLRHFFDFAFPILVEEAEAKAEADAEEKGHNTNNTTIDFRTLAAISRLRSVQPMKEESMAKSYLHQIVNLSAVHSDEIKLKNIQSFIKTVIKDKILWQRIKSSLTARPRVDLTSINIDAFGMLLFERFMTHCFVEPDQKMYERNANLQRNTDGYFYRVFMDSWRTVPDFWQYKHDVLLMELVLKHGVDCKEIIRDIDSKHKEYEKRLHFDFAASNFLSVTHPLYAFQTWCKSKINILHRLKHVTSTIIATLNGEQNKMTIFSSYQRHSHLTFIGRKDWRFHNDIADDEHKDHYMLSRKDTIQVRRQTIHARARQRITPRQVKQDKYIVRDIETELFESLQAFDLMKYGAVITRFMIDKFSREAKKSHYFVLGQLLYSLPDPIVIQILWESKHALHRVKPDQLKELCLKIQAGSLFKPSTCLSIAEFFDGLAKTDLVQANCWRAFSKEFEDMAFDDISEIESDHLMFILLNTPLPNHEGRCLIQLAQEGARVSFLNTERISGVINHMYRRGHLKPDQSLQPTQLQFSDMLRALCFYPFRFYLSPQGYHWVSGILYLEYLLLLFVYAYLWPSEAEHEELEIVFWSSNLGYILFEFHESSEKGARQYFNLAVMGDANVMDALVCLIWIVLFMLRLRIGLFDVWVSPSLSTKQDARMEKAYAFLFGIQILLITIRSFKILNNSQYFGALIRIIKSMLSEMIKFGFIFAMIMFAVLFGLWFIAGAQDDTCDFWNEGLAGGLLNVFEVFMGTKEISGFEDLDSLSIIYLVIASFFGTLLLLNLLIALMASKYDSIQEQAEADVMLNKTELSFDLLQRSRHMPPPLNIVLYVFAFAVWTLNFLLALMCPKCNIFQCMHYDLFEKMKTNSLCCDRCITDYDDDRIQSLETATEDNQDPSNEVKTKTIERLKYYESMDCCQVFKWNGIEVINIILRLFEIVLGILNMIVNIFLLVFTCGQRVWPYNPCLRKWRRRKISNQRMLHKGCYGKIKRFSREDNLDPVDGITMSAYFDTHEKTIKRSITKHDRIMLHKLTGQTLFCQKCYQPFLNTEGMMKTQLVSPIIALFDYVSAIVFIAVPIAWIPLFIITLIGTIAKKLSDWFNVADRVNEDYSNQDFDMNYFPQLLSDKNHKMYE